MITQLFESRSGNVRKEFGGKLYEKLFTGKVRKLWADYKQKSIDYL
jgi:hypothetical protein